MAFVHALHLSCNNYKITTKLKKSKLTITLKCKTNVFQGKEKGGGVGGGGEGICKKKMPQNLQHRYTCTYISACTCYAGSKCFSLGAIFLKINLLPTAATGYMTYVMFANT